jgi:CO/xanthine dehydrogenase Mo-binding subunit
MYKQIGKRIPKYDAYGHVTGKTRFVNDIILPGMLTVKALRSPVPRAKILNIDISQAEKILGVHGVITWKDVPNNVYGFYPDQPVLAKDEIRFLGQPVVAVAASNEGIAIEALKKVKFEFEELEPVLDPIEAMKPDSPLVRPEGNVYFFEEDMPYRKVRVGNVDEALEKADYIVEGHYETPGQEHAMLETTCTVADIDVNGRVIIYTQSQGIFFHHGSIASVLQMPMNKINMVGGTVGGGFGGRNDLHADHITALMALKTRKPCKWLWTREEEMVCSQIRGAWQFDFKDGVTKDGHVIARKIRTIHDTGAYAGFGPYAVDKSCFTIVGPYNIPNVWIDGYCVFTNRQVATSMRGFGINVGQFAEEVQMDKIAHKVGISPWELRFINSWKEGSISATRQKMHSVALIETLQATAKLSGVTLPEEYMQMASK